MRSGRSDLNPIPKSDGGGAPAEGKTTTLRVQCTSDLHKVTMTPMKPCGERAVGYEACDKVRRRMFGSWSF